MAALIVDDDADLVEMLQLVLELSGHSVLTATDGEQALQHWEQAHPDVVLLDIGMPGMDGYEVCERLRERDPQRTTAIIMLTARGTEADKQRAFDAGADEYVTKPFSIPLLTARMETVLQRYRDSAGPQG